MKRFLILGFITVVLAAIGWRLYSDLERYERTVNHPPSRKAQEDPYLAFRRWMALNEVIISGEPGDFLPESGSVLVHIGRLDYLYPWEDMYEWMENGGHLTITFPGDFPGEEGNRILSRIFADSDFRINGKDTSRPIYPVLMDLTGDGRLSGTVAVDTSRYFQPSTLPEGSNLVSTAGMQDIPGTDSESVFFLTFPVGSGRFTITGLPVFLNNNFLGTRENADAAWTCVAAGGEAERLVFLSEFKDSSRLGSGPWFYLVAASWIIAAGIAAWSGFRRPESILAVPPSPGSDIRGRLKAEGEFLRKHGGTAAYIEAGRYAVRRKLRRRGWRNPLDPKVTGEISRKTGVAADDITLALGDEKNLKHAEYLRVMKTIHKIEAEL